MGTIKKGILGGFSGKVGTVIGANWRGLDVMRSLPKKKSTTATLLQQEQRQRFAVVMNFLSPISNLMANSYGQPSGTLSRLNKAMSYHIKEATLGEFPDFFINYSKVVVTKGDLVGMQRAQLTTPVMGSVALEWEDNSGQVLSRADDLLVLVLYNVDKNTFVTARGPAKREDGTASIAIPANFGGDTLHVWASFVSATQQKAATSIYLGTLQAS